MLAVVGTALVRQRSRTDEVRTALELDADRATELIDLLARATQLHLRAVALAFVPVQNANAAPTRLQNVRFRS